MKSFADVQMDSLYKRLVDWNRCGFNDYQNQANNGARSTSMADKIVKHSFLQNFQKMEL